MPRERYFPRKHSCTRAPSFLFLPPQPAEFLTCHPHPFMTSIASRPAHTSCFLSKQPLPQHRLGPGPAREMQIRGEGKPQALLKGPELAEVPAPPPPSTGLSPAAQGTSPLQVETGLPPPFSLSPALNRINEVPEQAAATSSQAAIWPAPRCLRGSKLALVHAALQRSERHLGTSGPKQPR